VPTAPLKETKALGSRLADLVCTVEGERQLSHVGGAGETYRLDLKAEFVPARPCTRDVIFGGAVTTPDDRTANLVAQRTSLGLRTINNVSK
jgi:hypothetical protein